MQLDRTEIVIRQRTALELLDLSLLTLKRHFRPIAIAACIFGLPLLVIDILLNAWMLNEQSVIAADYLDAPLASLRWRYNGHLAVLYILQFQIVTLPTTIFLGSQIFFEPMPLGKLFRRLRPIAFRSLLVLGLMRLGLVTMIFEFAVNRTQVFDGGTETWILFIIPAIALLIRACNPFAPEILGLELCKLRTKSEAEISYGKRSRGLHRQLVAEHFTRFLAAALFAILLAMMLLGTALFLQGVITGSWQWGYLFDFFIFPLVLWSVGLFMAVFRFLSYIDSRIRLEGWELELRLRAEAERLDAPAWDKPPPVSSVAAVASSSGEVTQS